MASMKDGNDIQEDPPSALKQEGISKARKALQNLQNVQEDPPTSCSAEQIQITKDGNGIQEDPPRASKQKGISKERPRASLIPDLRSDGSILERITELDCSHPSSSYGYCDFCMEYLIVDCGPPVELVRRGITPTEDALWFRPRPRP